LQVRDMQYKALQSRLGAAKALVTKWREDALKSVPPEYAGRDLHGKYLKLDNQAAGWDDCAYELEVALQQTPQNAEAEKRDHRIDAAERYLRQALSEEVCPICLETLPDHAEECELGKFAEAMRTESERA